MGGTDSFNVGYSTDSGEKFLIFSLGREDYGIEITRVSEIIGGVQEITEIPELPNYMKGVINLRGKIIPVMDVRLRFKKDARDYDDRTCIIVVEMTTGQVGLVVDRVIEVTGIPADDIAAPPSLQQGIQKYLCGIGKINGEVKLLLDSEKILEDPDSLLDIQADSGIEEAKVHEAVQ